MLNNYNIHYRVITNRKKIEQNLSTENQSRFLHMLNH